MRFLLSITPLLAFFVGYSSSAAAGYLACPVEIDNFYKCERYKEAELLRREPSIGGRHEGRLRLNIVSGAAVWWVDNVRQDESDEESVRYALSKTFPGTSFVEISASFYEGSARYLVNRATGESTLVTGAALLSPDARRFVVWSDDEAYMSPFLRVYRIDGSKLIVEFEATELAQGWPQKVRWASSSEVVFRGFGGGNFRLAAHANQIHKAVRWRLSVGSTKLGPD